MGRLSTDCITLLLWRPQRGPWVELPAGVQWSDRQRCQAAGASLVVAATIGWSCVPASLCDCHHGTIHTNRPPPPLNLVIYN